MTHGLFRRCTGLFLALVASFAGFGSALAADGALDMTFGTDGKVTTDFAAHSNDQGHGIAIQSDGRIIVAGNMYNGHDFDFALARYNSDGSLDTTFDTDGKVSTDFGGSTDGGAAIALQPDGKIIVAGSSAFNFALARYNSDGSPDTTFDTDGKVTTDFGSSLDEGYAVALQPDGKIIVAGDSDLNGVFDFALARYNSDGSLDTTLDTDGKVTTDFGGEDLSYTVANQPDGKIIIAGVTINGSNHDFAVARYNADGSLDSTFDADGKVITVIGNGDASPRIALQPDGKIIMAGSSFNGIDSDFALARYNSNGSLDATFDTDGIVTTDFGNSLDAASAVALQPDGKIVVAGSSRNGNDSNFALARYNAASAIEVTIDIKPGRFPNRISLEKEICKDNDHLYVAILTTPTFDTETVDVSTLMFGDPLLSGRVTPIQSRIRDVDGDGDNDLMLTFYLCDLVTNEGLNTSSVELILTGKTLDGIDITGRDSVKVVFEDEHDHKNSADLHKDE